ncbi:hypothetical protein ACTWP6_29770 [Mycobacterium sp. 4D054]|uniref:hypothetical protein n=1 Tax=Mycobacterium sp. 4D054 TaxID=3457440 RepID=UPI003FD0B415
MRVSASSLALLDARADDVGSRIHWEMHVRAGGDPETVGLTAGAGHVFIYGPVRLDDRAVAHINALLDALLLSVLIRSEAFSFDVTHRRAFLI